MLRDLLWLMDVGTERFGFGLHLRSNRLGPRVPCPKLPANEDPHSLDVRNHCHHQETAVRGTSMPIHIARFGVAGGDSAVWPGLRSVQFSPENYANAGLNHVDGTFFHPLLSFSKRTLCLTHIDGSPAHSQIPRILISSRT